MTEVNLTVNELCDDDDPPPPYEEIKNPNIDSKLENYFQSRKTKIVFALIMFSLGFIPLYYLVIVSKTIPFSPVLLFLLLGFISTLYSCLVHGTVFKVTK